LRPGPAAPLHKPHSPETRSPTTWQIHPAAAGQASRSRPASTDQVIAMLASANSSFSSSSLFFFAQTAVSQKKMLAQTAIILHNHRSAKCIISVQLVTNFNLVLLSPPRDPFLDPPLAMHAIRLTHEATPFSHHGGRLFLSIPC
jgi:hypothetical protein